MLAIGSIACKKSGDGGGGSPGNPRVFQMTMLDRDKIINLVRSSLSTNNTDKAGTKNVQDLKVFFEANGDYDTTVEATLKTNENGEGVTIAGIYESATGIIKLDSITNWTNASGGPLFDTNPTNITVKITATANGFDFGSPKTFIIDDATLQFANIISNNGNGISISNAFGQTVIFSGTGYTDKPYSKYKLGATDALVTDTNYIIFTNDQDKPEGKGNQDEADNIRNTLLTNGSFRNYFSDWAVTFLGLTNVGEQDKVTNNAYFSVKFTPHFSNEMTNTDWTLVLQNHENAN